MIKFGPLFKRTQVYVPTFRGWLLLLAVVLLTGFLGMRWVYPFLAVTEPVRQAEPVDLLVMEGWAPEQVVEAAAKIYGEGHHHRLATTGGPTTGNSHLVPFETYALFGASRLETLGIRPGQILVTPPHSLQRRRTLFDILALRRALEKEGALPKSINVITADVHARRTRMHYRRIFGNEVKIGVIGVPPRDYDGASWWKTSFGAKRLIMELISTAYEFVWPPRLEDMQ